MTAYTTRHRKRYPRQSSPRTRRRLTRSRNLRNRLCLTPRTARQPSGKQSRSLRRRSHSTWRMRKSPQSTWIRSWASAIVTHGHHIDMAGGYTAPPIMQDGMTRGSMAEGSMILGFMMLIGMAAHIGQDGMIRGTGHGEILGTTAIFGIIPTIMDSMTRSSMVRATDIVESRCISVQEITEAAEYQQDTQPVLLHEVHRQSAVQRQPAGLRQALVQSVASDAVHAQQCHAQFQPHVLPCHVLRHRGRHQLCARHPRRALLLHRFATAEL